VQRRLQLLAKRQSKANPMWEEVKAELASFDRAALLNLESRHLAANTINQQLAAVRRLAHEAADSGLLSPELAAGI
jgi:hypothetical protein